MAVAGRGRDGWSAIGPRDDWVAAVTPSSLASTETVSEAPLEESSFRVPVFVARLVDMVGCEWAQGTPSYKEGDFVSQGAILRLKRGRARLDFNCGIQMVLLGGSVVHVESNKGVYLERGVLTALASTEEGKGFVVETPACKVIDQGTEFGVAVDRPDGSGWISVFQGAVDVETGDQVQRFVTADIVQVTTSLDNESSVTRHADKDDNPYDRFVRLSDFRPPLFSKVTTNSKRPYLVVPGGLREDALMYLDRRYQWNGVDTTGMPSFLVGADYVMTLNDDKFDPELEVRVILNAPATLYVFFDQRLSPPDWLSSQFHDTGLEIGGDEISPSRSILQGAGKSVDRVFSIWEKRVDENELTVLLGDVGGVLRGESSMYGIAALPRWNDRGHLAEEE